MVEWVPYWKNVDVVFSIETLRKLRICIRKERPELWAGNLFVLHHDNVPSHQAASMQNFWEQYVVNASSSIFPRLSALQFFYFPEVETGAEGTASGGFGRNEIENGRLPAEHSQIWLQKVLRWLVTVVVPIIPIFMNDLNRKSTIEKNRIDQKIGKKRLLYTLIDDRSFIYDWQRKRTAFIVKKKSKNRS